MFGEIGLQWRGGGGLSVGSRYISQTSGLKTGFFENSLEGRGYLNWRTIVSDVSPVNVTVALAAAGVLRKVYGFVWYYHSSDDVASRVADARLRNLGGALPTGMTTGVKTSAWFSGTLSLSADEEGMLYARADEGRDGMNVKTDDGVITTSSTATSPAPFPIWVDPDDNAEFLFGVGGIHANDRHSIYVLLEEWISL